MSSSGAGADLLALARKMAQAIPIKDRTYHLRTYKSCFLGTDAVMFLMGTAAASDIRAAIALGNKMMSFGLFSHVCNEHLLENDNLFYRFAPFITDEAPAPSQLDSGSSEHTGRSEPPRRTPPSRPPPVRPGSTVSVSSGERSRPASLATSEPLVTASQGHLMPLVLRRCIEYLNTPRALTDEGLFRTSGSKAIIDALDKRFLDGEDVDLSDQLDPSAVVGLMKLHLGRTLQPPLASKDARAICDLCQSVDDSDRVERIRGVLRGQTPACAVSLQAIVQLLRRVADTPENKMSCKSLAAMIAPSLFRNIGSASSQEATAALIEHAHELWLP